MSGARCSRLLSAVARGEVAPCRGAPGAPDLLRNGPEPRASLAGVSVLAGAVRAGPVRAVGNARFSERDELSSVTSDR